MCAQVKRQQDPEGLLCATLAYALERMGSLADVCAICDAPLAFGEASILPSVCGRPLCAHQLETFGKLLVWRLRGIQLTRGHAVEQVEHVRAGREARRADEQLPKGLELVGTQRPAADRW